MNALMASQIWEHAAEPARRAAAKLTGGDRNALCALVTHLVNLNALGFALMLVADTAARPAHAAFSAEVRAMQNLAAQHAQ